MFTQDKGFFDILTMAGGGGDPRALQAFVDTFKDTYNKLDVSGFTLAPMQPDFTFEQLEREHSINAMATYVGLNSRGTPISYEGASLQTGKIPRSKKYAAFDETNYRKMLIANSVRSNWALSAQTGLLDAVQKLINSHVNSLTYNRHQMVSAGKFELNEENNTGGITGGIFTAKIPEDNIVTKTSTARWFTDAENSIEGAASDPIKDLLGLSKKALKRGRGFHYEVDAITFEDTLSHSKVREAIGYHIMPAASSVDIARNIADNAGEEAQKAALERIIRFPIKIVDSISRVDVYNKVTRKIEGREMRSFKENVWALVPNGQIGEVLSVSPIKINPSDSASYAEYLGGRLLMTYDFDVVNKVQRIETEMTALVVPDKPKLMYILNIK